MENIDILVLCLEIKHQRRKMSGDNEIVVEAWIGGVRSAWHLQDHLPKHLICWSWSLVSSYMQKTCDVAEMATLVKKKLRKRCVNRDKM